MYICVCNGHAEKEIEEAVASGLTCPHEIYEYLGKPPQCGQCLELTRAIIKEVEDKLSNTNWGEL